MNSLSWLIYFAHATNGVGTVFAWIGGILMVLTALSIIAAMIHLDETDGRRDPLKGDELAACRATRKLATSYAWRLGIIGMAFFMLMAITPDRRTVLLIAASEIGERVVTSERVVGVVDPSIDLLKTWIEQQTASIRQEITAARPAATR